MLSKPGLLGDGTPVTLGGSYPVGGGRSAYGLMMENSTTSGSNNDRDLGKDWMQGDNNNVSKNSLDEVLQRFKRAVSESEDKSQCPS